MNNLKSEMKLIETILKTKGAIDLPTNIDIKKRVDELGRVQIPKGLRILFKIEEGDEVDFLLNEEYILIKKSQKRSE
jgi:AbrB family looped-hinge helix DNA binding protein